MTSSAHEVFQQAVTAMQAGKADAAERLFRQILQVQPQHVATLNLFCILLTTLGRFEEAERYAQLALNEDKTSDVTFYNYGLILKALKRPTEALEQFSEALRINAAVAETWNNRGTVLNELKRYREAIADFDRAIAINANYPAAFFNQGNALAELKLYERSLTAYGRAIELRPDLAAAWLARGNVFFTLKEYDKAFAAYDRALAIKPDLAEAWLGRGSAFFELGEHDRALANYERALAIEPDLAETWLGRGNVLFELREYDQAYAAYDRALAIKPDLAEAWRGRGSLFTERRQYDDAFAAYDRALAIKPDLGEAWLGRGNIFFELKEYDKALAAYDRALAIKADLAGAWLGRGSVFFDLKRYDQALATYDRALAIKPDLAEAWVGRGNVFFALKDYSNAFDAYERALALKSTLAAAWVGRGSVLVVLGQHNDALVAYDRALALKSDFAEAWLGRGNVLRGENRHHDAFAAFDRALALKANLRFVEGARLFAKLQMCDWTDLDSDIKHLMSAIREQKPVSLPFEILSTPSSSADQLQCARLYVQDHPSFPAIWRGEAYSHDRIRVAYLSADFHEHPTGYLLAGLFERHDRARFEVTGISFGPDQKSVVRQRLEGAFEHFIDVRGKSDQEIADLVRRLEIDVAVDLMGHTQNNRLDVFARRPAPIQVSYLGYLGTTGVEFLDYVIADKIALPFDQQVYYTEKIVQLPNCFMATDNRQAIAADVPSREEVGLPPEGFVFSSFNNSYKLNKSVFGLWMRLLYSVPGSVLWLTESNPQMVVTLRREAQLCDIDGERIVFAPRIPLPQHLARQRQAGLFLDTIPYNGGATAVTAIWAGVPLLTVVGETFVGRMAASMLHAVGLPELATANVSDYEALALKLANDPALLTRVRQKLQRNLRTTPLFDTDCFRRDIERAYATMVDIWRRGENPRSFSVEAA